MLNSHHPVQIGAKRYSREFQIESDFHKKWQSVLEAAHGTAEATCCCPGRGSRRLAIKRRESSGEYHLARFAGTGAEHSNECRFYAPSPETSGMQGYARGVVEEGDDGLLRIKLTRGLRIPPTKESDGEVTEQSHRAPGIRKPSMSQRALLDLLWQESRLNVWHPAMEGKRNVYSVFKAVKKAADRISAGRVRLSDVLLLPAAKASKAAAANEATVASAIRKGLRLVVVAPLARFDESKHGDDIEKLPVSMPFGIPPLYLQHGQWEKARNSFQREFSFWKSAGTVMAIAHVDVKQGSKWPIARVLEIGLMPVTEQWIPFDSSYEAVIAGQLKDQGRWFEKPLRFDAGTEEVFPDFWLLDVGVDYPMEVFGMDTPEYLMRKQIKLEYYNRKYGVDGWWSWNAVDDPRRAAIPGFPPSRAR